MAEPTFYAFQPNGALKTGIKKAFLDRITVTAHDAMDASLVYSSMKFSLVLEEKVRQELCSNSMVYCIVSFQIWQDNKAYAVARLFKEERAAKRQTADDTGD